MVDVSFIDDTRPVRVVSEQQVKDVKVKSASGTDNHDELRNRNLPNQHSIGSITGLNDALDAKQDVISDLSTIRSGAGKGATSVQSVTTGTTNGTIKVDGNSVSVYGLGSAAYTSSTAYDAAGSASTAETNAKNYADSLASNYATSAQGALADTAVQPADIVNMQTTTNLVTSVSSASTDSQYPSAKLFYDTCGDIETLINAL